MDQDNLSLDLLLQETLALSEILKETSGKMQKHESASASKDLSLVETQENKDNTEKNIKEEVQATHTDHDQEYSDKFDSSFDRFETKMLEETFDQIEMIQRKNSLAIIEELRKEQLRKEEEKLAKIREEELHILEREEKESLHLELLAEEIEQEELSLEDIRLAEEKREEELRESIRQELREEVRRKIREEHLQKAQEFAAVDQSFARSIFAPTNKALISYPHAPGIIYKLDSSIGTFCVRGFPTENIALSMKELNKTTGPKRSQLKLSPEDGLTQVKFFVTKSLELAEAIKEQIVNRRFPHQEDSVCNISDPGFSWWMNADELNENTEDSGRFEIFFKAHSVNRMEKFIQLGPIGDSSLAAQRMNQARALLSDSFPISEYSCDEKNFSIATSKPDHLGFIAFKNIFLHGENETELENFPETPVGRSLFYYFQELATVRKFWIEVKASLS